MPTCFWHFYKTDQEVPEPEKENQAFFMKGDRGQPNRATPVLLNVGAAQESGTDPPGSSSPGPWCVFGGGEGKAYTVFWGHLLVYDCFCSPCNQVTLVIATLKNEDSYWGCCSACCPRSTWQRVAL